MDGIRMPRGRMVLLMEGEPENPYVEIIRLLFFYLFIFLCLFFARPF